MMEKGKIGERDLFNFVLPPMHHARVTQNLPALAIPFDTHTPDLEQLFSSKLYEFTSLLVV